MKDPFFADIDWLSLEKRLNEPPIILQKKNKKIKSKEDEE